MDFVEIIDYINSHFRKILSKEYNTLEQIIEKSFNHKTPTNIEYYILRKHFLITAMVDLNRNLKRQNKNFRVDFSNDMREYAIKLNLTFIRENGCKTYIGMNEQISRLEEIIKNIATNRRKLKLEYFHTESDNDKTITKYYISLVTSVMRDIDETLGENELLLSIGTDEENNINEVTLI